MVMFIYHDDYYHWTHRRILAEIIIAKQRNGSIGAGLPMAAKIYAVCQYEEIRNFFTEGRHISDLFFLAFRRAFCYNENKSLPEKRFCMLLKVVGPMIRTFVIGEFFAGSRVCFGKCFCKMYLIV